MIKYRIRGGYLPAHVVTENDKNKKPAICDRFKEREKYEKIYLKACCLSFDGSIIPPICEKPVIKKLRNCENICLKNSNNVVVGGDKLGYSILALAAIIS